MNDEIYRSHSLCAIDGLHKGLIIAGIFMEARAFLVLKGVIDCFLDKLKR